MLEWKRLHAVARSYVADDSLESFVQNPFFPCVGAKSALNSGTLRAIAYHDICSDTDDVEILSALHDFAHERVHKGVFASLAIMFRNTPKLSEDAFEEALWGRLTALQRLDSRQFDWDPSVSDDPASPNFGMSFGGRGFYVIGMHPDASRAARRMVCATLVFNSHSQFEALRQAGLFDLIKRSVRERDLRLQNSINPMLADHGERSEAAQYSGRLVPANWTCPFNRSQR
jgi:FPC/CPF motif-containing protein YcgG